MTNKELVEYAMSLALEYGCQDAKVFLMQNRQHSIDMRNGEMEKIQHSFSRSLTLNFFIEGRDGFFYTNNVQLDTLKDFVEQAVQSTRLLEPDESRVLADPARYYRGGGPDLKIYDESLSKIEPIQKVNLVKELDGELTNAHPSLISVASSYTDRQYQGWYLISNGFEGYEERSFLSLTTLCTVEGEGGQHPMDGWGKSRIFFKDICTQGIAQTALERTLRKIGQRPIASGHYTMIVESPVACELLMPLLMAISGNALHQRTSFLEDCIGEQVASPLLDLVDDPLIPGTRGACLFDEEGVATCRRTLFEHGVLRTYLLDTPSSRKLNMSPTTGSVNHLILTPGDRDLSQLTRDFDEAVVVTDFNGGNCDPSTGYFSYGIEGYWVKNGVIAQPISGMNITGNMRQLWQQLVAVGNDFDPWESHLIPSLVFQDISFSGLGEG